MALWMTFLLGRQAMFGQEPPTYFRSTTTVFIPFLARVQERSLPAAPLPRMRRSYSSASMAGAGLPAVLGSSKCCVVFILFPVSTHFPIGWLLRRPLSDLNQSKQATRIMCFEADFGHGKNRRLAGRKANVLIFEHRGVLVNAEQRAAKTMLDGG